MRQFFDGITRPPFEKQSPISQIATQLQYVIWFFGRFQFFGMVIAVSCIRSIMTTILIIDDDAHILALYRGILEREGYEVVESVDGNRGIEICR
jgi:PleD family two-component response regulator